MTQDKTPNTPNPTAEPSTETSEAANSQKQKKRSIFRSRGQYFKKLFSERKNKPRKKRIQPPTNFKKELYAIPNLLTYFRIGMLPVILLVVSHESRWHSYLAAVLFSVACISDFFDGYLARKLNQITILGKLLDPLADKLIVSSTLIVLIGMGRVPDWLVIVLLAREFAVTGLRGIAASENMIIAADTLGKYKTAFQMFAIFFLLLHYPYRIEFYGFFSLDNINFRLVGLTFLYVSLFFSIISGIDYFWKFGVEVNKRYKESTQNPTTPEKSQ